MDDPELKTCKPTRADCRLRTTDKRRARSAFPTPMVPVTPLQLAELASALGIVVGPHGMPNGTADFSRSETARLLRMAEVLDQAQRLFGDRNRSLQWMKHQNRALSFKTPLAEAETKDGTRRVLALLRRIEDGTFA